MNVDILALFQSGGPITGLSRWIHTSMTQAGEDLTPVLIIGGALMGMLKGWLGVLAGFLLGCVAATIIANADNIGAWAHRIFLG